MRIRAIQSAFTQGGWPLPSISRPAAVFMAVLFLAGGAAFAEEPMARAYEIAAQSVSTALKAFAAQSDMQLIFTESDVGDAKTAGVNGNLAPREALAAILEGTELEFEFTENNVIVVRKAGWRSEALANSYFVSPEEAAQGGPNSGNSGTTLGQMRMASELKAGQSRTTSDEEEVFDPEYVSDENPRGIPEILVTGRRGPLNMDIERSADDIQPYVVFDREAIALSGAANLQEFLKNRVTANTTSLSSAQGFSTAGNSSKINLRGLGSDETLVLIDGRRAAGISGNSSNVGPGQPELNGLPLSAIERIEVLPTTASGIYGGGATGGVVNIVLRRDYSGIETTLTYGNTFESDVASRQVDISAGVNLENGRTNILFAVSYSNVNELLTQERDFLRRSRQWMLSNEEDAFTRSPLAIPLGATPNVAGVDPITRGFANLTLKDGTPLNSPITFVPRGYRGTSSDGGLALVANAGQYNLDLANTAQLGGAKRALLNNPTVKSAMVTLRRDFAPALQAFLELKGSSNSGRFVTNQASITTFIPPTASSNPFQETIRVVVPTVGADVAASSEYESERIVAGVIVRLSENWKATLDLTWNRLRSSFDIPGGVSANVLADISTGAIDVLRDLDSFPIDYGQLTPSTAVPAADTILKVAAIRLAGPLPVRLPAGNIVVSTLLERRDEVYDDTLYIDQTGEYLAPSRSQTVTSAYIEASVPLVSSLNEKRGVRGLDLQLAVRSDDYDVVGTTDFIELANPAPIQAFRNRNASVDPTVGLRYRPTASATLRSSYGTGYLPPGVHQLVPLAPLSFVPFLTDPLRNNEPLGFVSFTIGGNPDLKPEESESWSAGLILTPKSVEGLRLAVDWTKIKKTNNIATLGTQQSGLNELIAFAPERVTRAEPGPGETVGEIVAVDSTFLNIAQLEMEALDIAFDLGVDTEQFGEFDLSLSATRLISLTTQTVPNAPITENAGVASAFFNEGGGLKWRASGSVTWRGQHWTLGWISRFMDSYFLNGDRTVNPLQGSATVPSQIYHDVFANYRFPSSFEGPFGLLSNTDVHLGITNVFNTRPPVDVTAGFNGQYSSWGDPRLASYFLSVRKSFGDR